MSSSSSSGGSKKRTLDYEPGSLSQLLSKRSKTTHSGDWFAPRPALFPRSPHLLHDLVYAWPSLTDVAPRRDAVMVFSLCKLAGYCATRFG